MADCCPLSSNFLVPFGFPPCFQDNSFLTKHFHFSSYRFPLAPIFYLSVEIPWCAPGIPQTGRRSVSALLRTHVAHPRSAPLPFCTGLPRGISIFPPESIPMLPPVTTPYEGSVSAFPRTTRSRQKGDPACSGREQTGIQVRGQGITPPPAPPPLT